MTLKFVSLGAVAALIFTGSLLAVPVPATITFSDDSDRPAYITKADDASLYASQFEDGSAAQPLSLSKIKDISWREPASWKAAMELWNRREYTKATTAFSKASEDFKGLAGSKHPLLTDNIGAQALYYYMECLRRTGKFKQMMEPFVRVRNLNLSSKWQDQIRLFQGWALVAAGKWEPLAEVVKKYALTGDQIPGVGDFTVAPNEPQIKIEINVHQMAQIAFMRAIASDNIADKLAEDLASLDPRAEATREDREALTVQVRQLRSQALTDYSRAFTVNYGSERGLALRSMLATIRLLKKDESYEDNYPLRKEAHGVAVLFDGLSGGKLPVSLKGLLTPPVDPNAGEGA